MSVQKCPMSTLQRPVTTPIELYNVIRTYLSIPFYIMWQRSEYSSCLNWIIPYSENVLIQIKNAVYISYSDCCLFGLIFEYWSPCTCVLRLFTVGLQDDCPISCTDFETISPFQSANQKVCAALIKVGEGQLSLKEKVRGVLVWSWLKKTLQAPDHRHESRSISRVLSPQRGSATPNTFFSWRPCCL